MQSLHDTLSNGMSLEETLACLARAESVDGLALFGSQGGKRLSPVSDYDLLILIEKPPVPIFQMLSYIDGRMADIVFVETETADKLLSQTEAVAGNSFEGLFLQKMLNAQIVYDASGRLKRVQDYAHHRKDSHALLRPTNESDLYSTWFWLNHSLIHMKRMIQAEDTVYQMAVALMLMNALSGICRDYFRLRHLSWEGEKAAIRYLQAHEPKYLELLHTTIAESSLAKKLALHEELVIETLKPVGGLWEAGVTAAYLRGAQTEAELEKALQFWEGLLESR
jgi:predicted nucleotidyltransferase